MVKDIQVLFEMFSSLPKIWHLARKTSKLNIMVKVDKSNEGRTIFFYKKDTEGDLLDQIIFTKDSIERNGIAYVIDSMINKIDEICMNQKQLSTNVTL